MRKAIPPLTTRGRMEDSGKQLEGSPSVGLEVREAVFEFESIVKAEKEMSDQAIMISHMRDYALAKVFLMVLEGKPDKEAVEYLHRAAQSFKNQRHQQTGNPIRVFRRVRT